MSSFAEPFLHDASEGVVNLGLNVENVIMFLVPRLDKECTAPSSHATIERAKKKLKELEQQHGNKLWSELLKEELVKAETRNIHNTTIN